ncbi:MAG: Flp pilus assembly complex ATPase component TadA [Intrasporangium sp.]|uniref:CpaF family protein n=1 Tax=Intrasporangium sp. TaxID=1925024 RepID=UPI002647D7DB|nr:ATPase, T2SS/T4P/T4SS family [Intrasporangium sp.]MDN5797259.1 Flp pilus assembly complex ATPase component TadA [Intrasporangium sp.]
MSISDNQQRHAQASPTGPAGPADPTALPLFAAPPRPGRVRGSFTMHPGSRENQPGGRENQPGGRGDREQAPAPAGSEPGVPADPVDPVGLGAAGRGYDEGLDWDLVATLRRQASDRLSAVIGDQRGHLSGQQQRERGREIIAALLADECSARVSAGQHSWSLAEQQAMAGALDAALFGLGRLQPLVDDQRVENIIIAGCDGVWLELVGGRLVKGPPVASSNQELIDFLVFLASRSEANARPFSESQPRLHLRLDDGSRLAATAWVHPFPSVVIRRHRLRRVTFADLVGLGALSETAASFLAAAVKAGRSIVVSGPQGAGKTTFARALCAEIPRREIIGTFESVYELHLHELSEQHDIVFPWEARPGFGERGPDGRAAGEFTLADALVDSFKFNLSRQIVGEVTGPEILAMFKAMESSNGSISTTHARSAAGAIGKLVTCALEAGPQITYEYATRQLAANIDIVVHLALDKTELPDGSAQLARWVSEIITVAPGEREAGYAITSVFKAAPRARTATADVMPDEHRELELWGFDLPGFLTQSGQAAS